MSICSSCGKEFEGKVYPNNTCQGCYNYFHAGGKVNKLPPKGVLGYDNRGYVVCHICGKAYKRLGSHIRESHDMTISEYKEMFGLCNNAKTTESRYSTHMKELVYKNGMVERLIESGMASRIQKGEVRLRKGKQTRLQESIMKKERTYEKNKIVKSFDSGSF